jgi:glycosyltransferase involved in cell wall biosynthesis
VWRGYPFTTSWSLVEALSAGCLVIGPDTPPVREVINRDNGFLVPFFDFDQLAVRVIEALAHPRRFAVFRDQTRIHKTLNAAPVEHNGTFA